MIEWLILGFSFITLYLGVFWLQVVTLKEEEEETSPEKSLLPKISIIIPAWNEENGLWKTVQSLTQVTYPRDKIQIIVVDHESKDRTAEVARELIAYYPYSNIELVTRKRQRAGELKADSFNEGLKYATGELIGCVDADTVVLQNCLNEIVPYFVDKKVGAVISTIKVQQPRTLLEKIQHLEYIFATFTRTLMSKIDTLHVTPGALSVYRKKMFDLYGGFDTKTITEDLEMAMRLRYHGYKIKLAKKSITYTKVPATLKSHWSQRVRWFRGFIYNSLKYRKMAFKKEYDLIGTFQYPLNFLSIFTVITMIILTAYELLRLLIHQVIKVQTLGGEYFTFEFKDLPTLKHLILDMNIFLTFPIIIVFILALFFYNLAHKSLKEKWKYPVALLMYVTLYPTLRSLHWGVAIYKELFKVKNKWK